MEKITPEKAIELSKKLNKFTYFVNPFYLSANCLWENRNGEDLVFETEVSDGKQSLLVLPQKKENIKGQRIGTFFDEDFNIIKKFQLKVSEQKQIGIEYIYKTQELINLESSKFKVFRNEVNAFKKKYNFRVLNKYSIEDILTFIEEWASQKDLSKMSELTRTLFQSEISNCREYLNISDKILCKKIFIEIDGKLAGFALFLQLYQNLWVMLIQKGKYEYKGINKFLYYLASKEMGGIEFMTNAAEAHDVGLASFKENLNPIKKMSIYLVSVGN